MLSSFYVHFDSRGILYRLYLPENPATVLIVIMLILNRPNLNMSTLCGEREGRRKVSREKNFSSPLLYIVDENAYVCDLVSDFIFGPC